MRVNGTVVFVAWLCVGASAAWAQAPAEGQPAPTQTDETSTANPLSSSGGTNSFGIVVLLAVMALGAAGWFFLKTRDTSQASAPPFEPANRHTEQTSTRATAPAAGAPSIFISYRREDSADICGRISDRLIERFGRNAVFKDVDSIPIGRDFRTHLQEAVGRCDALLVIIGRQWSEASAHGKRRLDDPRDHLRIEVESALARSIPVIPVLVQGAPMPEEDALPESLKPLAFRNSIQVRPDPDFNVDLERLIKGMETQFGSAPRI